MPQEILTQKTYVFAKDVNSCYLFCNEYLAEIAGLDSPAQIVGKTDAQLCWHKNAIFFRKGDLITMNREGWFNVREKQLRQCGLVDILISKYPLLDKDGKCIGVIGSYIDVNAKDSFNKQTAKPQQISRFHCNSMEKYFTKREIEVFMQILMGKTSKQIAQKLCISSRTVEHHTNQIKYKLDCDYKSEIIVAAIRNNLIY